MRRAFMTASIVPLAVALLAATTGAQYFVNQQLNLSPQQNHAPGPAPYNYGLLSTLYGSGNIRGGRAFAGQRNFIEDSYFSSPYSRFYRDSVGVQDVLSGGIYGPGMPMYQPASIASRGSTINYNMGSRTADPFGLLPNAGSGISSSDYYLPQTRLTPLPARNLLSYPLGYPIPETLPSLPGTTPGIRAGLPFAAGLGLPPSLTGEEEAGLSPTRPRYLMPTLMYGPGSATNKEQMENRMYGPVTPGFFGQFQPNGYNTPAGPGAEGQPGTEFGQPGQPGTEFGQPGQPGQTNQQFPQVPGGPPGTAGLNLLQPATPYGPQVPGRGQGQENMGRQPNQNPNEPPGSLNSFLKTMNQNLSPEVTSSLSQSGQPKEKTEGTPGRPSPAEMQRMELLNRPAPNPGAGAAQSGPAAGAAALQTQLAMGKPNRADEQYFQLGLLDMEAGLYRQAAEAFTTVAQLGSTRSWEARRAEGLARLLSGDYYLAGMLLARTLVDNPEMTPSNFRVTVIVKQAKDWEAAEAALTMVLKTAPNSPAHSFDMAYLKIFTGRSEEAATYLKVAEKSAEFATAAKVLHEKMKQ